MIIPIHKPDRLITFDTPNGGEDEIESVDGGAIKFSTNDEDAKTIFMDYEGNHLKSYTDVIVGPLIDGLFTTKTISKEEVVDINKGVLMSSYTDKFNIHPGKVIEVVNYSDLNHHLINPDNGKKSNPFNFFFSGNVGWKGTGKCIIGNKGKREWALLFQDKKDGFTEVNSIDGMKIQLPNIQHKINTDWCYLYEQDSNNKDLIIRNGIMNTKTGFKLIRDDYEFLNFKNTDLDGEGKEFESEGNLIKVYYLKDGEPYVMIMDENGKVLFDEDFRDYNIAAMHDYDRVQIKDGYGLAIETTSDGDTEFNNALCDEDDIFKPKIRLITPDGNKIDIIDELNSNGITMDDDGLSKLTIDFVKDGIVSLRKRDDDLNFVFLTTEGKYISNSLDKHILHINGNYSKVTDICLLDNGHMLIKTNSYDSKIISIPLDDVFANIKEIGKGFYELEGKLYHNISFDKKLIKDTPNVNDNLQRFLDSANEIKTIDSKTVEIDSKRYNKKLLKLK